MSHVFRSDITLDKHDAEKDQRKNRIGCDDRDK